MLAITNYKYSESKPEQKMVFKTNYERRTLLEPIVFYPLTLNS